MNFNENNPIYLQISEWVCNKILKQEWRDDTRIPSVRDLGILLQVNPNTIMRAYEKLQTENIIYNKRGIGYFVCYRASEKIKQTLRENFLNTELPALFNTMQLLDINIEQLNQQYENYKTHKNENKQ